MDLRIGQRTAIIVFAAVLLGGCGSGGPDGTANGPGGRSVGVPGGATGRAATAKKAPGKLDICGLATPSQISAIVGAEIEIQKDRSGGKVCEYTSDERTAVTPTFDDNTENGYEFARSGDAGLVGGVRELAGVGDRAYVATGKFGGNNAATSAVEAGGHTVHVTVTSSSKSAEELGVIAEKLVGVIARNL
ncbi:MAG: hypothetical protein ABI345_09010 [Jatrophihabitans sp.]